MKPVYKTDNRFYKQLRPAGQGLRNYALWRPVVRFLCFWIPVGQRFWLDDAGFEPVNRSAKRQHRKIYG